MRFFVSLFAFASMLLGSVSVGAATLPTLPQAFVDTTYAPPSGKTITVNAGGNLQTAINSAALGDTIVLQAGVTFTGPFILPNKSGSGWIYIRGSNYAALPPPGTRVTPASAANMPKIQVGSHVGAAIQTSIGAHHYRFIGIEFKPVAGSLVTNLVTIGNGEPSVSSLPHDITIDRCYLHGDPNVGARRGVAMNGIRVAVIDSYLSDFKEIDADSQAVWTYNTPGPLKIVNNYLEAAGENFMSGGADPKLSNVVPSDIEIRGNHFFKPLAWMTQAWSVKNLLEFKIGQRILVEGNLFENVWPHDQSGYAINIKSTNQDGGAPWSITQDLTFRLNKLVNVAQGITLAGRDGTQSQVTRRILIEDNAFHVTGLNGAEARVFQFVGGPIDVTIRHNTGVITGSVGAAAFAASDPDTDRFDFRDNLLSKGVEGIKGTGTAEGTGTLNGFFTNWSFVKNAIIGASSGSYPANNFFPANNTAAGFVNAAAGDYRLAASSTLRGAASDGRDVGADIAAIQAAVSGQVASPAPNTDTDNDGVPYAVEASEGLNPSVKDNDVLANARLFSMQQYRDFLGREGDAGGVSYYTQQINSGAVTRPEAISSFLGSAEFQNGLPSITRLYFAFFLRIPDYPGLQFQLGRYRAGDTLEQLAQNFSVSPEFVARYGALSNAAYINLVYQNVLGRAPDASGYAYYLTRLDGAQMTRGMMMKNFSESPEFKQLADNEVFVNSVFVGLLRRAPDQAGLIQYVDALDRSSMTRLQVVAAIMGSAEYRSRFMP